MNPELWVVYAGATILLSLTPGPNSLLSLTHGGLYGARRTMFTALGSVCGFTLVIGLSMSGFSAVLAASEQLFTTIKWLGAAYLVYLGIKTWRAPATGLKITEQTDATGKPGQKMFAEGFIVAVSNPKVILFFAAFLPQFIDPAIPLFNQFLVMTGTFICIEFAFEVFLASCSQRAIPWLNRSDNTRWFQRVTGLTFIGAGTLLTTLEK
ncbi:MAG: LysE family translocator [Candidatus Sedimenticola sp. 6PFRAG5]